MIRMTGRQWSRGREVAAECVAPREAWVKGAWRISHVGGSIARCREINVARLRNAVSALEVQNGALHRRAVHAVLGQCATSLAAIALDVHDALKIENAGVGLAET